MLLWTPVVLQAPLWNNWPKVARVLLGCVRAGNLRGNDMFSHHVHSSLYVLSSPCVWTGKREAVVEHKGGTRTHWVTCPKLVSRPTKIFPFSVENVMNAMNAIKHSIMYKGAVNRVGVTVCIHLKWARRVSGFARQYRCNLLTTENILKYVQTAYIRVNSHQKKLQSGPVCYNFTVATTY